VDPTVKTVFTWV